MRRMRSFAVEDEAIALPIGAWAKSHRVHVRWQGKHIVSLSQSEHRAYLFPVYTPNGFAVTSESPVDHPHHNSLWIGADHVSCWLPYAEAKREEANYNFYVNEVFQGRAPGRVLAVARECEEVEEDHLRIVQTLNWQGPCEWGSSEGRIVAVERRTIDIYPGKAANLIDLRSQLQACEWEIAIGPTRHAYFGVRMAERLHVTSGAKVVDADGHCRSEEIKGQHANWVDCSGEVADGRSAGVALFPHPANANNEWSIADWGYISVNPLRWSGRRIEIGERMDLALRVVVHDGNAEQGRIAGFYQSFLDELNDKETGA